MITAEEAAKVLTAAVGGVNCVTVLRMQIPELERLESRITTTHGRTLADSALVVFCDDDANGRLVGNMLMPGHDFDQYRAQGARPYGRGIVHRSGLEDMVAAADKHQGERLRTMPGTAVVMFDFGVVYVTSMEDIKRDTADDA